MMVQTEKNGWIKIMGLKLVFEGESAYILDINGHDSPCLYLNNGIKHCQ